MHIDLWVFVALVSPTSLLAWGFLAIWPAELLATEAGWIRARHGTLRHALARDVARVLARVAWAAGLTVPAVAWWRRVWPHEAARWLSASVPLSLVSVWMTRLVERRFRQDASIFHRGDDDAQECV
jgi:hypothetical protein